MTTPLDPQKQPSGVEEHFRHLFALRCQSPEPGYPAWLDARGQILEANSGLAVQVAKQYVGRRNTCTLIELFSAGNTGLLKAIDTFDVSRGFRFSTHAFPLVRSEIQQEVIEAGSLISVPTGSNPARHRKANISPALYEAIDKALAFRPAGTHFGETDHFNPVHYLPGRDHLDIDAISDMVEFERVKEILARCFCERDQRIIVARFGLDGGEPMTLEEVGHDLGVSRERVRQLENATMDRLRKLCAIPPVPVPGSSADNSKIILQSIHKLKAMGKPISIDAIADMTALSRPTVYRHRLTLMAVGQWPATSRRASA